MFSNTVSNPYCAFPACLEMCEIFFEHSFKLFLYLSILVAFIIIIFWIVHNFEFYFLFIRKIEFNFKIIGFLFQFLT